MMMSFIAGGAFVGLIWILQDQAQVPIEEDVRNEIVPAETVDIGPLGFDEWAEGVAQVNQQSVVGLSLGGTPRRTEAQAIRLGTNGYLVTSAASLQGAREIAVVLPDGRSTPPAQLVGTDPVSGVAVLKINGTNLSPPTFADDGGIAVSDRLVAFAQTPSLDEPHALPIDVLDAGQVASAPDGSLLSDLFRLSGNLSNPWSGAAILEENGGIVAMAVEARDGGHFAVPISTAREVAEQIIDSGEVAHRAWLGVEMGDLSDGIKTQRELLGGVLMSRVWDETPAARGGLVSGDIIVGLDDANILDRTDLQLHLGSLAPGDAVEVRYSRVEVPQQSFDGEFDLSGELHTTTVTVGARPA